MSQAVRSIVIYVLQPRDLFQHLGPPVDREACIIKCVTTLHYLAIILMTLGIPPDCSEDDSYSYDFGAESGMFLDGTYQVIKWTAHQTNKWATLLDENMKEM